jgi:hypothetical protein
MSVLLDPNMPLEGAEERLAELEASDTAGAAEAVSTQGQRESGADRAGAETEGEAQNPISEQTDTPAAAEPGKTADPAAKTKSPEEKADAAKPEEKPADQTRDPKGRYAASRERLEKTWDSVNKRKGELDTREQQLAERENTLKQQQTDWESQRQQSQAQHKPEDYDRAAASKAERAKGLHLQADGLEAKAQKMEDDGKYADAADLRNQAKAARKAANKEEGNAEDLRAHAESLRKNPPPSAKQLEEKLEAQRKEWMGKAAAAFPDLAKKDSPLQKAVVQHLNALWQQDRQLAANPAMIYHVTRYAAAEAAAARVPDLEKKLGQLEAKVKEYEQLTSPGGPGAAQRPPSGKVPATDDEERAELREMASGLNGIR